MSNTYDEAPYKVLPRKYRPQTLEHLVGQEVLVTTLCNAIKYNRIAHAFMFSGIRGIGKTTSARIVAKTINCQNRLEKDGYYISCEECENCTAINEEKHPDIIELDAASKNSVYDIKEVIENAMYRPIQASYKVYIIDEVHMLSKSAFNALLKILEEPPEHSKFILATTEIRKVPVTVLSRCQRFDLKRLTREDITGLLAKVCKMEKINYEEEALKLLARVSEGSARDALSLLDQAISSAYFKASNLTKQIIIENIGISDEEQILKILENLIANNAGDLIENLASAHAEGKDLIALTESLLDYLGEIIKLQSSTSYKPEFEEDTSTRLSDISTNLSINKTTIIYKIINKALNEEIKPGHDIKLNTEMVLLRAMYSTTMPSPKEILNRIGGESDNEFPSSYN